MSDGAIEIHGRAAELLEKIEERTARVGIIGMGYVGMPLAVAFADAGFSVLGFDVDQGKVERLNRGDSYIAHVPSQTLARMRSQERFAATADFSRLREADAVLICVPTPLTRHREPDLSHVTDTARAVASALRPGHLVVLESTTFPGTTDEILRPILDASGLRVGEEYFLAYSPEREDPNNPRFSTRTIPKVVGGVTPHCLRVADALYRKITVGTVPVSSTRVAEAAKILENTYRAVNIALVNELKVLFDRMGIDIWEVIEAAKTKPFGFQAFYPGPGLGGHCIPVDPFYLTWKARQYDVATRFIELAGEVNTAMPEYVVGKVAAALNERGKPLKGSRILVLGVAYKPDVDDQRESPALKIMQLLRSRGAVVSYNDPHVPRCHGHRHYPDLDLSSQPLTEELLARMDCVLLVTNHSAYDYAWIHRHASLIVDTRNAFRGFRGKVVRA